MRYEHMIQGTFISRPNRFIAHVAIRREAGGEEETVVCHVKTRDGAESCFCRALR